MIAGEWDTGPLARRWFGAWHVIGARPSRNRWPVTHYVCRCACGFVHEGMTKTALVAGLSRSCGCVSRADADTIQRERTREADEVDFVASEGVRALTRTTGVDTPSAERSA